MTNSLRALGDAGQAVWLDYLHPKILDDGELKRMIAEDGVTGLTSNPAIFEKAIGEGDVYDVRISSLLRTEDREIIAMHRFGESAPIKDLLKRFGFTAEHVRDAALAQLEATK